MSKTNAGRFFEDYRVGDVIAHAVPRTISGGERALYHALYPARGALHSSDEFARQCGLPASPLDDLIAFHVVFGKTVPDVSLNAVANLGYAEGRWLAPVWVGDTLTATSQVIGVKQNSNGKTGVVWVRTTGTNQHGKPVLDYVRWVMVKRRADGAAPVAVIPALKTVVDPADLVIPEGLDFTRYNFAQAGEPHRFGDYTVGEVIDHVDGVTVEEAEHMMLALNGGAHANPCFAGDTVRAWSEVLDKAETSTPSVGAVRLRLVATKGAAGALRGQDGKYLPEVLLDLDYWALMPV